MGVSDEAVLRAIADATVDLALVIDQDGAILWRHRSSARGPDPEPTDVVGTRVVDRIHPEDLPDVLDGLARLQKTDATEVAVRCRAFDGADPTLIHEAEVRGYDTTDAPGIEGVLVLATIRNSRHGRYEDAGAIDFSLADASPLGLAIVSASGEVLYGNDLFRRWVALGADDRLSLDALPGLDVVTAAARSDGSDERSVVHDGTTLRLIGRRLDGPGAHVVVSIDDITAEVDAVAARMRSEQTFRATFEHTPAGIALVGPDGTFLDVNPSWTAITGYPPDELIGRTFAEITHPDDLDADQRLVEEILDGTRDTYRMEKRYRHRSGQVVWVDLRVAVVRDDEHRVEHFVSQILDITGPKQIQADMRARERELTHQATHDHLTGLPNRALLEVHLRAAIERTIERGEQVSVLLIDLDDFKPINDTQGHATGDLVLVELGSRLQATCEDADIVARLGGDEFVAVTGSDPGSGDGQPLAETLLAVLADPLSSPSEPAKLTASIGITQVRADDTVESLLARADAATYAAKGQGGNTVARDPGHPA